MLSVWIRFMGKFSTSSTKKVLAALLAALGAFVLFRCLFTQEQATFLALLTLMVVLWTNGGLPLGTVSLLPILLFPAFGIAEVGAVTPNYAKSIIFLFLGGFMLALAMQKCGLHEQVAARLLRIFPKTATGLLYAMAMISALLSSLLSNTTVTLMLLPIGLFLTGNERLKIRLLLAIAYGASIGGILTPIGTPPNLLLIGYLESVGMEAPGFGVWVVLMLPVVGVMLLIMPRLLALGVEREAIGPLKSLHEPFSPDQKKLIAIIGLLSLLLFLNTPLKPWYPGLGLNEKALLLGAGLLLFLPGIDLLEWQDTRAIPYEIIFLFGAGFTIAFAFSQTHLAEAVAAQLAFVRDLPFWLAVFLAALFVSFVTEITSNTALIAIVLPVVAQLFAGDAGADLAVLLVATVAASYAFMLPIATPPNAIVMGSNIIPVATMARLGFVIDLLGVAVVATFALLFWSFLL